MRRDVRSLELWRRQHPPDFNDQPGGRHAGVSYNACKRAVWVARLGRFGLVIHGEGDEPWIRFNGVIERRRKRPVR